MADLTLQETLNGTDFVRSGNDLELTQSLYNQVYLALFGGNPDGLTSDQVDTALRTDWWGNSLFFPNQQNNQFNSRFQAALYDIPITSGGLIQLESIAKSDLQVLAPIADIDVDITMISNTRVRIDVTLIEKSDQSASMFTFLWDGTKNTVITDEDDIPLPPPNPPENLVATAVTDELITLTWDASEGAISYNLERSLTSGSGFVQIANLTGLTYDDTDGLVGETQYFYRVRAVGDFAKSGYSNEDSATTLYGLIITTDIDPGIDGPFDPQITYTSGDTPKWEFEDGSFLFGANISTLGNGLDGTEQEVKLLVEDRLGITETLFQDIEQTGDLPEVWDITGLLTLNFGDNNLDQPISSDIGNLTSLVTLNLRSNNIGQGIPSSIGLCVSLVTVDLRNNNLTDPIPTEITNLINVVSLVLRDNNFTSSIPLDIGNLTLLETWDFANNPLLTGGIPPSAQNLVNLTTVNLSLCNLIGAVLSSVINAWSNVTLIQLRNNAFSGNFPDLTTQTVVTTVDVSLNQFSGDLPDVSALVSLVNFRFQNNSFTGYKAGSLTTQANLADINVRNNSITTPAIDNLLGDCVASLPLPGRVVCTVNIGNNSAPSAVGLAHIVTLQGAGWTVIQ